MPNSRALVGGVESPVLFQFPDEESKDSRSHRCDRDGDRLRGVLASHNGSEYRSEDDGQSWQQQFVRNSYHRKVLNRVDLRFNQQVHAEANHKVDQRPYDTQDGLHCQCDEAFTTAES